MGFPKENRLAFAVQPQKVVVTTKVIMWRGSTVANRLLLSEKFFLNYMYQTVCSFDIINQEGHHVRICS